MTEKQRVSAQDVAREAGVSRTTVSFVLNNTPGKSIPEGTRQRVLDAAARLGYIPNEDARRLARIRDRNLGLFICHSQFVYSDAFITRALEGMSQAVNRLRARLIVQPVTLREASYLDLARSDGVEGIILINTHDEDPALRELSESDFPAVSMDRITHIAMDQVYVDNASAAVEIVNHLIGLGHRRIAMITHALPVFFASRTRLNGYKQALRDAGVDFDPDLVRYADFSEQSGYEQMNDLLKSGIPLTAVFAGNDVVAYGAMQAILQSGRRIPDDISLVGFDDDYMSRFLNPGLTTMVLPAAGHGSAAVETLMDRINGRAPDGPVSRILSAHITVRESAGPPRV
jgi:LacI family transcriptional regulator